MRRAEIYKKKKIEIVVEALFSSRVLTALEEAGAKGHSLVPNLRGRGAHGLRRGAGLSAAFDNVMIICLVDESLATKIMAAARDAIGDGVGIIYASDVEVRRDEHF